MLSGEGLKSDVLNRVAMVLRKSIFGNVRYIMEDLGLSSNDSLFQLTYWAQLFKTNDVFS